MWPGWQERNFGVLSPLTLRHLQLRHHLSTNLCRWLPPHRLHFSHFWSWLLRLAHTPHIALFPKPVALLPQSPQSRRSWNLPSTSSSLLTCIHLSRYVPPFSPSIYANPAPTNQVPATSASSHHQKQLNSARRRSREVMNGLVIGSTTQMPPLDGRRNTIGGLTRNWREIDRAIRGVWSTIVL